MSINKKLIIDEERRRKKKKEKKKEWWGIEVSQTPAKCTSLGRVTPIKRIKRNKWTVCKLNKCSPCDF